MTIKLASVKTDLQREADGELIDIPELPGVALLVRSLNYPPYRLARDQQLQKFARTYGKKPVPADEMTAAFGRLYATHIVLGWRGFDVDYSPDTALETLSDPAYRELVVHVEYAAGQVGRAEIEFVEELEKN